MATRPEGRYLDLRKGVGATDHHHPTPQGCLLPPALGPEPQAPDTDTPWRTDPHGLDTPPEGASLWEALADGRGSPGPHAVVVSQLRRAEATLGQEAAGGQACWEPGFTGPAPSLPQENRILRAGGQQGPPVFAAAGVWAGVGTGQSSPGLREGTSLGPGSAHPQEGPPTRGLGGSAQPLESTGRLAHVYVAGRGQTPKPQSPAPRSRGPQSEQGFHRWSIPAGDRDGTPGVDAGLVSGEREPSRPTLAAGLSLGLSDTGAGQASLVVVQGGGAGSLSILLSPASALPGAPPQGPSTPLRAQPGSGRPREQRVDCASFWACSPPGRCPRGALGVMFVFVAKRESSGQAARAQRTNGLRYQPQAQEPRSRQPVLDPAGLPPSPPWPPEAPRRQPGSSVPALRLVLCRHLPSPAHGMRLSSPRPARHPLAL
ncbi:basic salivary proline-rich protein 1-like [Bubalus bubalis]|uniref:basic salivary proline-rich protein 1-like n=1 Tax=Bubalus bubalis TaxID=89462 RepID=UPI001E1B9A0C|nr:basic salivary proline-rich protein 1-like [Bubalus bubalis]